MLLVLTFGLLLGFFGSMPLAGPIAVLVFRRGLDGRYRSGLSLAVGAALPESVFAFLAFWGVSSLLARYPFIDLAARAIAAVILVGLGVYFALQRGGRELRNGEPERARGSFALGFTITALNPTFIATWTAAVATLHATGLVSTNRSGALPFALGVCAGIVGWFWVLLEAMRRYKGRFRPETLNRVLRLIGAVLLVMGVWFGYRFFRALTHQ